MKINELPIELQEKIKRLRSELKTKEVNTPYEVCFYNVAGTRYFRALRICREWRDNNNGNRMPFGGGTYWKVDYGEVGVRRVKDLIGSGFDIELCLGKTYSKVCGEKDIVIPPVLETKKEVMALKSELKIFN